MVHASNSVRTQVVAALVRLLGICLDLPNLAAKALSPLLGVCVCVCVTPWCCHAPAQECWSVRPDEVITSAEGKRKRKMLFPFL